MDLSNIISNLHTDWLGKKIIIYDSLSSTMSYCEQNYLEHGSVVIAESQTEGVGRIDHKWESPKGNIYLSVIADSSDKLSYLTQITALAVYDLISAYSDEVTLKWPNDVLVAGKKIAGILLKKVNDKVIIGIGINVNQNVTVSQSTSLSLLNNNQFNLELLIAELLNLFEKWYSADCSNIFNTWKSLITVVGHNVRISSDLEYYGNVLKIDDNGFIVLQLLDGTVKTICCGDLFLYN